MTETDRCKEAQKSRATCFNALAVGSIIAGGIIAVADQEFGRALMFLFIAVLLHYPAIPNPQALKVDRDV